MDRPQGFFERFWDLAGGVSIRTKIFGIVLGSTLLLSVGFVVQVRSALTNLLEQNSREEGISIARDVAARATDMILVNDLFSLHQLLSETQANFSDVRYAFVVDPDGRVLAHTFGSGFPLELLDVNAVTSDNFQNMAVIQTEDGRVWDIAVPIFDGRAGTARVGISDQSVRQTTIALTTQLGLTIIVVLAGSLLAATFLTWILTRPILGLVDAASTIAQGDFSPRVRRWANDEIGDLAETFNQMAEELGRMEELRQERENLRRQLLESVITAQEEERRRISRELHDSTSQSLTSLMVGLHMLETEPDIPAAAGQVRQLQEITRRTLDEIHALAVQLRPIVLDDMGLVTALEHEVLEFQKRFHIQTDFQTVNLDGIDLPAPIETAVYRIIQETLANIAKYAQATQVSILLELRDGQLSVIVEDDGRGFDTQAVIQDAPHQKKLGIYGIRERVDQLGGQVVIESTPGKGSTFYVRLPVEKEDGR